MSLAIKFGDSRDLNSLTGFIYFDAVQSYQKSFSGKLTSHPIDAGASISDHFYSDNPQFNLSAVVSGIDISNIPQKIIIDNETPLNVNIQPDAVSVNNFYSNLTQILPDSVLQFMSTNNFSITGGNQPRKDYKRDIQFLLETLMSGLYFNETRKRWENRVTPVTLFELDGSVFSHSYSDLVMTSMEISEGIDDWTSLNLDMKFEKARFVTLEKVDAPKTTKKGTKTTQNKGKVTTSPEPVPTGPTAPNKPRPTVLGKISEAVK